MSPIGRLACAVVVSVTLVLPVAKEAQAQDTTRVRPDSLAPAPVAPDSTPLPIVDSLPPPASLPIFQPETPVGPLTPGSRHTFTRDSILWAGWLTLADLLADIPGVYVLRAGFVGLPEYIQYAGRGGAALELYWDGVPVLPVGGDTLSIDPNRYSLTYLRRVDVEVVPGLLRVYLVSERHELPVIRSKVRIQSGTFKAAQYTALFQKRFPSGFELDVAGNFAGTEGAAGASGADAFDLWASVAWLPTPRVGARYQLRRQSLDRDGISGLVTERLGARTDMQFTFFAQTSDDGLGLRAELGVASGFWSADSGVTPATHGVRQVFADLRYRLPNLTVAGVIRGADARSLLSIEGRVGWAPLSFFVLSGDAGYRRHTGDRTSSWLRGSAGLHAGPVSLVGEGMIRDAVPAPALIGDTAQATTDLTLRAGIDWTLVGGQASIQRRDAFQPHHYPELPAVPALAPAAKATYVVAEGHLRPISPLTLSGTFSHPIQGEATDFQPPEHLRAALTFRSKYWRTFRSGAFDLKLEAALERWAAGTAGVGTGGSPIVLPAGQFWELQVEIQLVTFTAFWVLRNSTLSEDQYVPGLEYPGNAQFFGASWVFTN